MPDRTPGQQALLDIWGHVISAVGDSQLRSTPGGITQYVWEAWKQGYLSQGLEPPRATIADMGQLISSAAKIYNATTGLGAAIDDYLQNGRDRAIAGEWIAPDINSRSLTEQPLGPNYSIRFEATYSSEGATVDSWYTWRPGLQVPQSISELLGNLEDAALGAAEDYGVEFQGLTGNVSITTY